MTYLILDAKNIIVNVIDCDETFARNHGAVLGYEGARLGDTYEPPRPPEPENMWDEMAAAYKEGVQKA